MNNCNLKSLISIWTLTGTVVNVMAQNVSVGDSVKEVNLHGVDVAGTGHGTVMSHSLLQQTEILNHRGLTKMACCTLAESFDNSATTSSSYSDAITGTKHIQLLGLSGVYTQILSENIPTLNGLNYGFGWDHIPPAWLSSVQISKGASSVVNGYQSVTGQINMNFAMPNTGQQGYVDMYSDEYLHTNTNAIGKLKINDLLSVALMLHTTLSALPNNKKWKSRHDRNNDQFKDMPDVYNLDLYNRWLYANEKTGVQSRFDFKLAQEYRRAGQDSACVVSDGVKLYKVQIHNTNVQLSNKTGFSIGDKEGQSLGLINSLTIHRMRTVFGMKTYDADETNYYGNLIFNSYLGDTKNKYQMGLSFQHDRVTGSYSDSLEYNNTPLTSIGRTENVYGAFAEYTNTIVKHLVVMAGARMDYHSNDGWLFTPRMNIKYSVGDFLVARVSGGKGFRSSFPITENIGLLASSRNIKVSEITSLGIENAWNFGGNLLITIPSFGGRYANLSIEYYHTLFLNRTVVDTERDRNAVYFYNLVGKSYADVWQADFSMPVVKGLTLYAAYRYNRQTITYTDGSQQYEKEVPLVSSYRGVVNLSYSSNMDKWMIDVTLQLNGPCRLPGMNGYASRSRYSSAYPVYFAQVTHRIRKMEFYAGAENIFDFRQKQPVIGSENPYQKDFDASMVWAPVVGRKFYAGVRLYLGKYL